MSNLALDFIVLLTIPKAPLNIKPGIFVYYLHNSSASFFKLEKAESITIPAIDGSLSACIKAVTAPIDLPHIPIVSTFPQLRK